MSIRTILNRPKRQGFTIIEVLLVMAVVLIVSGIGWWVLQRNTQDKQNSNMQSTIEQEGVHKEAPSAVETEEAWTAYSNKEGKFSLRYPASWKLPRNAEVCMQTALLIGPDEESTGICESDKISQVMVHFAEGDQRMEGNTLTKDVVEEEVTIDGVDGIRKSLTYIDNEALIPYGTKYVGYTFYVNGRTYWLAYYQLPTYTDVLSVFETIVKQTFRFSE